MLWRTCRLFWPILYTRLVLAAIETISATAGCQYNRMKAITVNRWKIRKILQMQNSSWATVQLTAAICLNRRCAHHTATNGSAVQLLRFQQARSINNEQETAACATTVIHSRQRINWRQSYEVTRQDDHDVQSSLIIIKRPKQTMHPGTKESYKEQEQSKTSYLRQGESGFGSGLWIRMTSST